MTIRTLSVAGLAFLVFGWASVAAAQSDCKTVVPASIWGPNETMSRPPTLSPITAVSSHAWTAVTVEAWSKSRS